MVGNVFVGIDVSKDKLDVGLLPEEQSFQVSNDEAGHRELVDKLKSFKIELVVLEATGGYQTPVVSALIVARLPVAVVNPAQVRSFARAMGRLAKTDAIDAMVLAKFGRMMEPEPRGLKDEEALELEAMITRRRQIVDMIAAEANRVQQAPKKMQPDIREHIEWLKHRLKDKDLELRRLIENSPVWREKENLLRSIPGVGPITSMVMISQLPELGTLGPKQISALVGVAPLNRDSGTVRGKREIWGGRASVRRTLYMAALTAARKNPVIRTFYERLCSVGKPKEGPRSSPRSAQTSRHHERDAQALRALAPGAQPRKTGEDSCSRVANPRDSPHRAFLARDVHCQATFPSPLPLPNRAHSPHRAFLARDVHCQATFPSPLREATRAQTAPPRFSRAMFIVTGRSHPLLPRPSRPSFTPPRVSRAIFMSRGDVPVPCRQPFAALIHPPRVSRAGPDADGPRALRTCATS